MKIKYLNTSKQNSEFKESFKQVFTEILDEGNFVSGRRVEEFEKNFAAIHQANYAVATNSGTSALILALQTLGIGPGDEVIVPNMTFIATIEAVAAVGATSILVDISKDTWNLDLVKAEMACNKKTKAMIFVHLHGNPSGISSAVEFANSKGIFLIEDAAQAHLASEKNLKVGNFGVAAAFSFYPGKNLGALGEGGCTFFKLAEHQEKAKLIRNWGSEKKYVHLIRGTNLRMDEMQAAFLNIKLKRLVDWNKLRRYYAQTYNSFFDSLNIQRPIALPDAEHVYHVYAIRIRNRDYFREELLQLGIESGIHYPNPISELVPWKPYCKTVGDISESHSSSEEFLSLPLSDHLEQVELEYILDSFRKVLASNKF